MTRVHSAATASHSGKEERSLEALMGRYIGKPLPGITTGTKPPSTSATATAAGDDNNYGNDALEDSVHLQEYNTKRSKLAFFKQQEGVRVISSNNTNNDNKDNKDKDKDESLKRPNASRRHKISNAFDELQRTIEEGYSTEFEVEIEGDGEGEGDDLLLEVEGVVDADGYQDKDEDRDPRSLSTKSAVGTLITPNSTPSFSSKKKLNICNDNASISGTSCHNKRSVHELVNKSNWADGGARKDSETAERRRMKNTNNSHVHHPYDYGGIEVSNSDDCNNNVQPSPLSFSEKEFLTESLADYIKHTPKNTILVKVLILQRTKQFNRTSRIPLRLLDFGIVEEFHVASPKLKANIQTPNRC